MSSNEFNDDDESNDKDNDDDDSSAHHEEPSPKRSTGKNWSSIRTPVLPNQVVNQPVRSSRRRSGRHNDFEAQNDSNITTPTRSTRST